jgi:hypothetical protein
VDWAKLASVGVERDDMELDGHLEPLLRGEAVGPIRLSLTMLGTQVELDAMIRLTADEPGSGSPTLEIDGVGPAGQGVDEEADRSGE